MGLQNDLMDQALEHFPCRWEALTKRVMRKNRKARINLGPARPPPACPFDGLTGLSARD